MKVSRKKLDLILARNCQSVSDLRKEFSSATIAKIRNDPQHEASTKTVGKLARALNCQVEEIIEGRVE